MIKTFLLFVASLVFAAGCNVADAKPGGVPLSYAAADATYKIVAYDKEFMEGGEPIWSGTGWKLTEDLMMTAGHVCDGAGGIRLQRGNGKFYPAKIIAYEYTDDIDLCMIKVNDVPGNPLWLASGMPVYDAPLLYVGAPHGIWANGGMMPVIHGNYGGGNLANVAAAGGASGSAILSQAGVVGVLVSGYLDGSHLTFMITIDQIRDFILRNQDVFFVLGGD